MAEFGTDTISARIARIRLKMDEAARKAGTKRVWLVAAAKTNGADAVREAVRAGVDAVGENRVQEMLEKLGENAYEGAPLHFIGHLQTNKVRSVVGRAALIQSVSSLPLAREIGKRAQSLGIAQDILLEINIGREETKSGFLPEDFERALEEIAGIPAVRVKGLMAIPPATTIYSDGRRFFSKMYQIFIDTGEKKYDNISMDILSMGMSADYTDAIEEGSNMVRIGSAVFGERKQVPFK